MRKYISGFRDAQAALDLALQLVSGTDELSQDRAVEAARRSGCNVCSLCDKIGMPAAARTALGEPRIVGGFCPDDGHRISNGDDGAEHLQCGFSPLRCAKWQFAVVRELAEPAEMKLLPVTGSDGEVVDFEWLSATPVASHLLDCAGVALVGERLVPMLDGHLDARSLFDAYRISLSRCESSTFNSRNFHGAEECVVSHVITPSKGYISVILRNHSAIDRAKKFKVALDIFAAKYAGLPATAGCSIRRA